MNKMFKKLMAVTATLAIAATMSVSAFAEGETEETTPATPSASHTAGSVEVKNYTKPDTAVDGTTQYTVMVFLDSEDGISADEIYYINQGSDPSTLLADMRVKATTAEDGTTSINLPDGDYTVRIGNSTGSVVNVDLKVSTVVTPTTKEITFLWGDVNLDGAVDANDITALVYRDAGGKTTYTSETDGVEFTFTIDSESNGILWGDVNLDGAVDANDITTLVYRDAGGKITYGDYTIDQDTTIEIQ